MTDLRRLHLLLILLDITAEEPYNQQALENERHTINVGVNVCVCVQMWISGAIIYAEF